MKILQRLFYILSGWFYLGIASANAQVILPLLVSDGMVLQRDVPLTIWGRATIGEMVTVRFRNKTHTAITDNNGKWMIILDPMKTGGPLEMQLDASNHIVVRNIMVGDVWVCSGQSNMELPMERVKEKYAEDIKNSTNPFIRQFAVTTDYSFTEQRDNFSTGKWSEADPVNVLGFTAVGYFFARSLYEKYKVPIGLIRVSVGGSPAEAWLSERALKSYPAYLALTEKYKNSTLVDSIKKRDKEVIQSWEQDVDKNDLGLSGTTKWFAPDYNAAGWNTTQVPGFWNKEMLSAPGSKATEKTNGAVWFRKEIEVPASMVGKPAKLVLGAIVDRDIVYVNGEFAGTTGYQYPPRRYELPAGLLRPGKNVIVVRVINNSGRGGFVKDKTYSLSAGDQVIDLKGAWQYQLGYAADPQPGGLTTFHYQPAGLFNAMIAPLLYYHIKGVIWYQGESNTSRPGEYEQLFTDVIKDWRLYLQQGDFPFLYVQLAAFMEAKPQPSESNWAALRNAQLKTLKVNNTGMAVTIDVGEWNDIHPLNKSAVGNRLALIARKKAYGDNKVLYSGPAVRSVKRKGDKIIIKFTHTGSGLASSDGKALSHFAISGEDKKFIWAVTGIKGRKIIVHNTQVPEPKIVRYAWADNPAGANLMNKEGLPASPFEAIVP